MTQRGTAVVLASLNIDLTSHVQTLPAPGDTVLATATSRSLGGKGANQAVALARHGVAVHAIGAVGDEGGDFVLQALKAEGVDVDAFAVRLEQHSIRFVLNLAPVIDVLPRTIALADPLIVNESEARRLTAAPASTPIAAVRQLLQDRARSVVITLGGRGSIASTKHQTWTQGPVVHGPVKDTTGAGDAFVGSLCAALCVEADLPTAVHRATDYAGTTVTRYGTTQSYPLVP